MDKMKKPSPKGYLAKKRNRTPLHPLRILPYLFPIHYGTRYTNLGPHFLDLFSNISQTHPGPDDSKVMIVKYRQLLLKAAVFNQMAGGASAGSRCSLAHSCVWCGSGWPKHLANFLSFPWQERTQVVIVISFGQLGSAGSSMGIVTIKSREPWHRNGRSFESQAIAGGGTWNGLADLPTAQV